MGLDQDFPTVTLINKMVLIEKTTGWEWITVFGYFQLTKFLKDDRMKEVGSWYGKIGTAWQESWDGNREERLTMDITTKMPSVGDNCYWSKSLHPDLVPSMAMQPGCPLGSTPGPPLSPPLIAALLSQRCLVEVLAPLSFPVYLDNLQARC